MGGWMDAYLLAQADVFSLFGRTRCWRTPDFLSGPLELLEALLLFLYSYDLLYSKWDRYLLKD
jgi:hypothetical protein